MRRGASIALFLIGLVGTALLLSSMAGPASGQGIALTSDVPQGQPQPVGTTVTWKVLPATGLRSYQFSIAKDGGAFEVVSDFSPLAQFPWTPIDEGQYSVKVVIRTAAGDGVLTQPFTVTSRLTENLAVVTPTPHPLVALYSAPPCAPGAMAFVEISPAGGNTWVPTSRKPCVEGRSVSFWAAGMRAETTYRLRHATVTGAGTLMRSGITEHTTGPVSLPNQGFGPIVGPEAASFSEGIILHAILDVWRPDRNFPVATDLFGRVIWYFDKLLGVTGAFPYLTRTLPGGTMLTLTTCCGGEIYLAEIDLAGNSIRRTTMSRINVQLQARGEQTVRALHHDAVRMPNGQTLVLGMIQRDLDGYPEPTMGDMVIALDQNLQVVWTWNAFDHLDVHRRAILGENCYAAYGPACAASSQLAHDWLHSNSIAYSPADGNIIVSIRHQDWVVKIDYRNGTGSGDVLWRLGKDGDFTLAPGSDPWPWFSHQHDASYVSSNVILLYDNGNTRCAGATTGCRSRGQVIRLDEANRTAELLVNADLGVYADRLGSAQFLRNGKFAFGSGYLPGLLSLSSEVGWNGQTSYAMLGGTTSYRSFRMKSLYEP